MLVAKLSNRADNIGHVFSPRKNTVWRGPTEGVHIFYVILASCSADFHLFVHSGYNAALRQMNKENNNSSGRVVKFCLNIKGHY